MMIIPDYILGKFGSLVFIFFQLEDNLSRGKNGFVF